MSDNLVLPPLYVLVRINEEGNFQLALANGPQVAKERMANEGFRVFELTNERTSEDLSI